LALHALQYGVGEPALRALEVSVFDERHRGARRTPHVIFSRDGGR
jgi:hypothetical protein